MDLGLYILDGHTPVPVTDTLEWGRWFETHRRECVVAQDRTDAGVEVSTVFLGLDHNHARFFGAPTPPMLFETAIFAPTRKLIEIADRYSTWDEAEQAHRVILQRTRLAAKS